MTLKKILLVETDDSLREIVAYVLKNEGFDVIKADPDMAFLMKYTTADLILLDEWINKDAGDMLCREIKAVHELQHIPVVILSTAINIEEIVRSCNADGFVRKPFDVDDLVHEIKRCLKTGLDQTAFA